MSFRRSRSAYSSRSSRTSSRFSFVEGNFRIEEPVTPIIPEVHITRRERPRSQQLSINDAPMMLLPKARLRDSLDFYDNYRRSAYNIVADTSVHGLHISTIQSVNAIQMRTPSKSAMKSRCFSAMGRSDRDADSGIGSLKRSVTFDNLTQSRSTVYRSEDDLENIDNLSDGSVNEKDDHINTVASHNNENADSFFRLPSLVKPDDDLPAHLDTFGTNEPAVTDTRPGSREQKRNSDAKRRKHSHTDRRDVESCEICGTILSDEERVMKRFGKVDTFLDWVLSRWGKTYAERLRRELQYIPRPSYVFRGHVPHFCNFVHKLQLHNKHLGLSDSAGFPDSELDDDLDLIGESVDGSTIGQWRKGSNASPDIDRSWLYRQKGRHTMFLKYFSSIPEQKEDILASGIEGRPTSPSSVDGRENLDEENEGSRPVTGIEIRITPSVQSNYSDKASRGDSQNNNKYSKGDVSHIPEEDNIQPPKTPTDAWGKKSPTLQLGNIPTGGEESDENNNREPSPRQPPPSPEPIPLPTAPKSPPPTKRRTCVSKKTKKPIEKQPRKMKEPEIPKEPDPPKTEPEPTPPPPAVESVKPDVKPDIKVPDLPIPEEKKPREKTEKAKPHRQLIEVQDDLDAIKQEPTDVLNEQLKQKKAEIDWSAMDINGTEEIRRPPQIKSWIQGRLALSQQSSRFELPMDMKLLETMSPEEYIKKYCIITSRRQNLYQKIFLKNKDKSGQILFKDIDRSLKDVLVNTITTDQIKYLLDILDITEETKIDYKLFAGMAAYAERVLYPKFVTEDTIDMPEYQKEKIECADFCALDWKFHGVNVSPKMRTLLKAIS